MGDQAKVRLLGIPDSSNISDVGYDPESQQLFVRFKSSMDSVYVYENVLATTFVALVTSESLGKYFGAEIKARAMFPFRKVDYVSP